VDQPALCVPELESNDVAALTIAALALPEIRNGNGRRIFSAESDGLKFSPMVSGTVPSRRRSYCLPPSTLSELRNSGGELCA
jgi:hypothetical protein